MSKQVSYKLVSLTFSVLVLCFAVGFYVLGWTPPTAEPPGNNVDSPLNVGSDAQYKSGGLILNTGGADNGLIIDKGNVGIGTTTPQAKLDVNGSIIVTGGSGDINDDGKVDVHDRISAYSYVYGDRYLSREEYARADVNGDGRVTWADVNMIGYLSFNYFPREKLMKQINSAYGLTGLGNLDVLGDERFYMAGNVGIGTTDPKAKLHISGTPGTDGIMFPDGTVQTSAASGCAITYIDRVAFNPGTLSYPDSIPTTARNIIVTFFLRTDETYAAMYAEADNFSRRLVAYSYSVNNSDDAASDMNTMLLPYSESRTLKVTLSTNGYEGAKVYFDGYME